MSFALGRQVGQRRRLTDFLSGSVFSLLLLLVVSMTANGCVPAQRERVDAGWT